ncbi:hypothetical protein F511_28221 [Dorcoceras hygrometricum]|uniref:Uncharacterized protein n=1 Tax=Dorcoceras hygrometricum TaxID=472368 RepID=A0A2Z7CUU5_9LAMI|nr:hypothetical protein F511_28221 [Dorcoceras hygrometricum]
MGHLQLGLLHGQQSNFGNLKTHTGNKQPSPRGTGVKPQYGEQLKTSVVKWQQIKFNSGHGVCEYMGATHSSQHTAPDATHISTRCCPTHLMWDLPTPRIVANRSQQGDEVRELPAHLNSILDLNTYPNKLGGKSDAYANRLQKGDVFATSPASRKRSRATSNEASQQEESNATTHTSIGAVYRRRLEKIRFEEQ